MDALILLFSTSGLIVGALLLWTSYTKSGKKWLKNL